MENPMNKWMIWGENPLFSETAIWIGVFSTWDASSLPILPGGFQVSLGTLQQGSGDCEGLHAAPAHSVTAAMAACEKGDLALSWLVGAEDWVGEMYLKITPQLENERMSHPKRGNVIFQPLIFSEYLSFLGSRSWDGTVDGSESGQPPGIYNINLVNNGDELPTSTGLAGFLPSRVFQMNDQMSLSKIKILKLDSISI